MSAEAFVCELVIGESAVLNRFHNWIGSRDIEDDLLSVISG